MPQRHRLFPLVLAVVVAFSLTAAPRRRAVAPPASPVPLTLTFDFRAGDGLGWEPGVADFSEGMDLRTTGEVRQLPVEAGAGTAWYLSGWNYSDDMFLFLRRGLGRAEGIRPNQNYVADFRVTLATNVSRECGGIGGAPGEAVFVKLGASPIRPEATRFTDSQPPAIRMNVDKGEQSTSGVHATVAGTISAEQTLPSCGIATPFVELVRRHRHPYAMPASPTGELWLLFGLDSGFEGFTQIYIQSIEVTLTPVADDDARVRWQRTYADIAVLVAELRTQVDVRAAGAEDFDEIGSRCLQYAVGGPYSLESLWGCVFDTAAAAERARGLISADGSRIGATTIGWIEPPHFFMGDHFIAVYAGSSPELLSMLTARFGPQFAGR